MADAELEYKDHTSPSVYLRFPVISLPEDVLPAAADKSPLSFAVWTTTPWTLPANAALAVHPDLEYVVVKMASCHPERLATPELRSNGGASYAKDQDLRSRPNGRRVPLSI